MYLLFFRVEGGVRRGMQLTHLMHLFCSPCSTDQENKLKRREGLMRDQWRTLSIFLVAFLVFSLEVQVLRACLEMVPLVATWVFVWDRQRLWWNIETGRRPDIFKLFLLPGKRRSQRQCSSQILACRLLAHKRKTTDTMSTALLRCGIQSPVRDQDLEFKAIDFYVFLMCLLCDTTWRLLVDLMLFWGSSLAKATLNRYSILCFASGGTLEILLAAKVWAMHCARIWAQPGDGAELSQFRQGWLMTRPSSDSVQVGHPISLCYCSNLYYSYSITVCAVCIMYV